MLSGRFQGWVWLHGWMDSALSQGLVSFHLSTLPPYVGFSLELSMVSGRGKQLQACHPSKMGIHYKSEGPVKISLCPINWVGCPSRTSRGYWGTQYTHAAPGSQAHPILAPLSKMSIRSTSLEPHNTGTGHVQRETEVWWTVSRVNGCCVRKSSVCQWRISLQVMLNNYRNETLEVFPVGTLWMLGQGVGLYEEL